MEQLFRPRANSIARAAVIGVPLLIVGTAVALFAYARSDFWTAVDSPNDQTVPFSHEHHVGGLRIDCRFFPPGIEPSVFACIPPTVTCIPLHLQVWKFDPVL